jgi:hypothetical protein
MNLLVKFFTSLNILTKRLGLCGNVGLIAGAIAGLILMYYYLLNANVVVLSNEEAAIIALMLTAFTWIINMFFLWILARLSFFSVAVPSFVNCLLTCFAVVFVVRATGTYIVAWLIGIIIGIIIGMLLCRLNFLYQKLINK